MGCYKMCETDRQIDIQTNRLGTKRFLSKHVALSVINLKTNHLQLHNKGRLSIYLFFFSARDIKNWLDSDTKEPNQPGTLQLWFTITDISDMYWFCIV
jgi:hypothetical protein